jgi:hypothetical protein
MGKSTAQAGPIALGGPQTRANDVCLVLTSQLSFRVRFLSHVFAQNWLYMSRLPLVSLAERRGFSNHFIGLISHFSYQLRLELPTKPLLIGRNPLLQQYRSRIPVGIAFVWHLHGVNLLSGDLKHPRIQNQQEASPQSCEGKEHPIKPTFDLRLHRIILPTTNS